MKTDKIKQIASGAIVRVIGGKWSGCILTYQGFELNGYVCLSSQGIGGTITVPDVEPVNPNAGIPESFPGGPLVTPLTLHAQNKMKSRILNLIKHYSFNQVESMLYNGQIGQLTFEAYCRVWEWIAPRFGGTPGWKQDCYWKAHGKDRFAAKINRVRLAFGI